MIRFFSIPFENAIEYYHPKIFRIDNADLNIKYLNKISIPASYK